MTATTTRAASRHSYTAMAVMAISTCVMLTTNTTPPHSVNSCTVLMSDVTRETRAPRRSAWTWRTELEISFENTLTRRSERPAAA